MNWAWYLFSFKGRINRARYIVAQLVLITCWLVLWPLQWKTLHLDLVVAIAMWWINTATTVKRLHDRNWSGWWAVPIFVFNRLAYLYYGLFIGGYFGVDISIAGELLLVMTAVAISLLGTWIFIELVFLIGTEGRNRFGPDPLAHVTTGTPENSRSDQHGVPAFLVHRAGAAPTSVLD